MVFWAMEVKATSPQPKAISGTDDTEPVVVIKNIALLLKSVPEDRRNELTEVYVTKKEEKFLIAILSVTNPQISMDLELDSTEEIKISVEGVGVVHLTGNEVELDDEESVSGSSASESESPSPSNRFRGLNVKGSGLPKPKF